MRREKNQPNILLKFFYLPQRTVIWVRLPSAIYEVIFKKKKNAKIFLGKKASPSANAEDLEDFEKKSFGSSQTQTGVFNLAVHRSTHYSIPPSMLKYLKTAYTKNQTYFSRIREKSIK